MAEREGFEPSMGFKTHTPLAGERLQPLGHLSGILSCLILTIYKTFNRAPSALFRASCPSPFGPSSFFRRSILLQAILSAARPSLRYTFLLNSNHVQNVRSRSERVISGVLPYTLRAIVILPTFNIAPGNIVSRSAISPVFLL